MPFDPHALPVPDLGLLCKNCGYMLAGLTQHRCPECGRDFTVDDHIPRSEFPPVIVNQTYVPLSREIRELMRDYRIPCIEAAGELRGLWGVGTHAAPGRLCVPRERYFEVIDLLRCRLLGEPMPAPPASTDASPDWNCAGCGESNPGAFDHCWNCGAASE